MIREVRSLAENNPIVNSILQKSAMLIAGKITYQARTGDRELNKKIESAVKKWSRYADITGRFSLTDLIQLAIINRKVDGECGFIVVDGGGFPRLQMIEADRIGDPYNRTAKEGQINGINVGPWGNPVSYEIYDRSINGASYTYSATIPEENFIHYMIASRPSQYHRVSSFAQVIDKLKDLDEILENEQIGVKANSSISMIAYTESGNLNTSDILQSANNRTNSSGEEVSEIETGSGRIFSFKNNEKVQPMLGNRPSTTFQGFVETLMRSVCASADMSYALAYDTSSLKGPAARTELAQADRAFAFEREKLKEKILDPIKNRLIFMLASDGEIDANPFDERLYEGEWMFPPKMTIDAGRESQAAIAELRAGLLTEQDWYSSLGEDAEEKQNTIARNAETKIEAAKEISETYNIDISYALQLLGNPAQQVFPQEQKAQESPENTELPAEKQFAETSHKPTASMADNAKRALEVREEKPKSQRGMTSVGLARARDISNRRNLSTDTVRRMLAYFNRHEVDKKGNTWDEKGKGWQAWNGWGGDEGYTWAKRIIEKIDKEDN